MSLSTLKLALKLSGEMVSLANSPEGAQEVVDKYAEMQKLTIEDAQTPEQAVSGARNETTVALKAEIQKIEAQIADLTRQETGQVLNLNLTRYESFDASKILLNQDVDI